MHNRRAPRPLARRLFGAACASALALGPLGVARLAAQPAPSFRYQVAEVAERVTPSVVNVWCTQGGDDRRAPGHQQTNAESEATGLDGLVRKPQVSLGSGVVLSEDGKILTNAHVVRGARKIRVTLHDGSEREAKLVGADPRSDLAVLTLVGEPPPLRPITFADSSKVRLGELVLAIGNPFGVGQTVTMGIVSATGRASVGIADYEDFIQTDAAVNPGNSGGALVNLDGELVGINTAILSHHGGFQGIAFAIPSAMARPITEMLIKDGRVSRGWLGAVLAPIDEQLAAYLKLSGRGGVVVVAVDESTPAALAGLEPGDVILSFDGQEIRDLGRLRNLIAMRGAGAEVVLVLLRDGSARSVTLLLGELPDGPPGSRRGS